jgi:hypothetical protein
VALDRRGAVEDHEEEVARRALTSEVLSWADQALLHVLGDHLDVGVVDPLEQRNRAQPGGIDGHAEPPVSVASRS